MSKEDNSESINFENEQIEQRTLNSDEERKIKKTEESKTFLTLNNYNYNRKSKEKKNRSVNKFKKSNLPPLMKTKRDQIYAAQREPTINSVFATSYNTVIIDPRDNDEIFLELHNIQKDLKNINKELKSLQKDYGIIEERNLANKYIMEKLLDLNDDYNSDNNNNNNYNSEKINEEEEFKNNGNEEEDETRNKKKKKKYKYKLKLYNDEIQKITALKKQIILYDNTIQMNESKLEELKKKKKQMQYQQLISSLNSENSEIKELLEKIEQLNNALFENDTKIQFYNIGAQQYSDNIIGMEQKMQFEKNVINVNQTEIKNLNEKKDNLTNKQKILDDEIKEREKKKNENNDELKKLKKEIEDNEDLLREKEKNELFLLNFESTQKRYIYEMNKFDTKMKLLKQENDSTEKDISDYELIRPSLIEKSKIPKRNQEKMKSLEKEIYNLTQEIKKRNEEGNQFEKIMNEKITEMTNINDELKTQINNYIQEKIDLENEIELSKNNLTNKKNEKQNQEKEYSELEINYENAQNDYEKNKKEDEERKLKEMAENENKEKMRQENELEKEKSFNEAKEKFNQEIKELKLKNSELKKENGILKSDYEKKMKDIKLANEASNKLKKTMEEMKNITPS